MNQRINQNPFLFAFGVPRSGTTLLQRMLNCHPELAVANDSHFIPRALEQTDKCLLEKAERADRTMETAKLCQAWWDQHFLPKYDRSYKLLAGQTPAARAGQPIRPN